MFMMMKHGRKALVYVNACGGTRIIYDNSSVHWWVYSIADGKKKARNHVTTGAA